MAAGTTSFTQEELDFLTIAVLSKRIANRGEVLSLDNVEYPTVDMAINVAKKFGPPTNDGYRFFVRGRRGQYIQWWDGADVLTFENRGGVQELQYDVGKGHMGFEVLYHFLERQGIRIKYGKGIRDGEFAGKGDVVERVINFLEQNAEGVLEDWRRDRAHRFWMANADQAKCFAGWRSLIDPSTNTSGAIGGRSRTNRLYRHYLATGVTIDTVTLALAQMERECSRRVKQKDKTRIWYACGDYAYDILADLYLGTSTRAGKIEGRLAQERAMKNGEKYSVTIPENAFTLPNGITIVNDPVFAELKEREPAANPAWDRMICRFDFNHFGLISVMDEESVSHGMPYNQRLERTSFHGEWTEWCDQPNAMGVLVF